MGFLGRLFGSQRAVDQIVKAGIKGIDALKYTAEEKAADQIKAREKVNDQVVDFMRATTGYNLARRVLAFIVVGIWALCLLFIIVCGIVDGFNGDDSFTKAAANVNGIMSEWAIHTIVLAVILFYFQRPDSDRGFIESLMALRRSK